MGNGLSKDALYAHPSPLASGEKGYVQRSSGGLYLSSVKEVLLYEGLCECGCVRCVHAIWKKVSFTLLLRQ